MKLKMADSFDNSQASFNQAQFQQIRLHELFQRIDRFYTNPLAFNPNYQDYNYKIIFNDLVSIFLTISAKLTETEKGDMMTKKQEIDTLLSTNAPHKTMMDYRMKRRTFFSQPSFEELNNLLLEFKINLEHLADIHGFGNPTKADPRFAGAQR
jgi:hypothetical protein